MVDGRQISEAFLDPQTKALQNLKEAVELNLCELTHAFKQQPIDMIAWRARNLLELLIWVEYCVSSAERAKRFCEDSLRDALDMLKLHPEFATEYERLTKMLKDSGIKKPKASYLQVSSAGKELGKKKGCFDYWNKLFSKFAHPTAIAVMNDLPLKELTRFKNRFLIEGMRYGVAALEQIDRCLTEDR